MITVQVFVALAWTVLVWALFIVRGVYFKSNSINSWWVNQEVFFISLSMFANECSAETGVRGVYVHTHDKLHDSAV